MISRPGGAALAGDPQSPAPADSGYPGVAAAGSAAVEPGATGPADAEAPSAFSTAPGAGPEPVPAEPLTTNDASADTRWPEIQAMFVDDPRASVQLVASLLDHSVDALVASFE
jgi:hypothetical protein